MNMTGNNFSATESNQFITKYFSQRESEEGSQRYLPIEFRRSKPDGRILHCRVCDPLDPQHDGIVSVVSFELSELSSHWCSEGHQNALRQIASNIRDLPSTLTIVPDQPMHVKCVVCDGILLATANAVGKHTSKEHIEANHTKNHVHHRGASPLFTPRRELVNMPQSPLYAPQRSPLSSASLLSAATLQQAGSRPIRLRVLVPLPYNSSIDSCLQRYLPSVTRPNVHLDIGFLDPSAPMTSLTSDYANVRQSPFVVTAVQKAEADGCDGVLIDTAFDTALNTCKHVSSRIAVVGAMQAALGLTLSVSGSKFSILSISVNETAVNHRLLSEYRMVDRLASVRPVNIPVLDLQCEFDRLVSISYEQARRCVEEDGADTIILGCTGMIGLATRLQQLLGPTIPVIDGAICGLYLLEDLVRMNLRASKKHFDSPDQLIVPLREELDRCPVRMVQGCAPMSGPAAASNIPPLSPPFCAANSAHRRNSLRALELGHVAGNEYASRSAHTACEIRSLDHEEVFVRVAPSCSTSRPMSNMSSRRSSGCGSNCSFTPPLGHANAGIPRSLSFSAADSPRASVSSNATSPPSAVSTSSSSGLSADLASPQSAGLGGLFNCSLCQVTLDSQLEFDVHIKSAQHMHELIAACDALPIPTPRPDPTGEFGKAHQRGLDLLKEPLFQNLTESAIQVVDAIPYTAVSPPPLKWISSWPSGEGRYCILGMSLNNSWYNRRSVLQLTKFALLNFHRVYVFIPSTPHLANYLASGRSHQYAMKRIRKDVVRYRSWVTAAIEAITNGEVQLVESSMRDMSLSIQQLPPETRAVWVRWDEDIAPHPSFQAHRRLHEQAFASSGVMQPHTLAPSPSFHQQIDQRFRSELLECSSTISLVQASPSPGEKQFTQPSVVNGEVAATYLLDELAFFAAASKILGLPPQRISLFYYRPWSLAAHFLERNYYNLPLSKDDPHLEHDYCEMSFLVLNVLESEEKSDTNRTI